MPNQKGTCSLGLWVRHCFHGWIRVWNGWEVQHGSPPLNSHLPGNGNHWGCFMRAMWELAWHWGYMWESRRHKHLCSAWLNYFFLKESGRYVIKDLNYGGARYEFSRLTWYYLKHKVGQLHFVGHISPGLILSQMTYPWFHSSPSLHLFWL